MGSGPDVTGKVVALVVAAGVAVAVASNGIQLLLPASSLGGGWLRVVQAGGAVLVAVGVAGLLRERSRIHAAGAPRRDPTVVGVRAAATIMAVVTLLAFLDPPAYAGGGEGPPRPFGLPTLSPWGMDGSVGEIIEARSRGGGTSPVTGEGAFSFDPASLPSVTVPAGGGLRGVAGLLPWLFGLTLLLLGLRILLARSRRREGVFHEPILLVHDDVEESLEASLAEVLRFGGDPRGQITRAYHSLLSALALAGGPREPQEAPHEHLRRVLAPLGVRPDSLHRLTSLYVLAQFGGCPVTERHRVAAVHALEASLADLRGTLRSAAAPLSPLPSSGSA